MRRFLSIVAVVLIASLLSSCSLIYATWSSDDAPELANAQFTRLVDAINSGDAEQLKDEFSDDAVGEQENLDSEIVRLFELLPDGVWSWRRAGCVHGGGSPDGIAHHSDCSYQIVLDSAAPVYLTFSAETLNSTHTESVGVYSLAIITEDDEALGEGWEGPGLYVPDSPPIIGARL